MIKKILGVAAWVFIGVSAVFLIFGFGEDGLRILRVGKFWIVVDSLWIVAILLFTIEGRLR